MNTPAHLIFGMAAFGRADAPRVTAAALAGSLIPDLSLYGMVGWHLRVIGTPPEIVFGELYFSERWMRVFAVDNSFLVWGALFGLALWTRRAWAVALTAAALLHLALDFPLHAGDGRPQFWPLTMWVFDSPLSYWDSRFGGRIVGLVELAACGVLAVWTALRFPQWWVRGAAALLLAMEALSSGIWRLVF